MADVTLTRLVGSNIHTFTFEQAEVATVRSTTTSSIDQTSLPGSGPIESLLFDFDGVNKTITITGNLFETTSTRVTGTGSSSVTTILQQKQWLEEALSGNQLTVTFSSTYEAQTYDGSSQQTTTVMSASANFTEGGGNPQLLPFGMTFLVGT